MYVHNFDGDFFGEGPDKKRQLVNQVPYMLGTCDSEFSWILPTMMKLPSTANEEAVLKFLKMPLIEAMGEEQATKVAAQSFAAMVQVYKHKSPFTESAAEFPLYILRRALSDQVNLISSHVAKTLNLNCYSILVVSWGVPTS